MKAQDIRKAFIDYFVKQGHRAVPSSPVVPHEDPTLLFTNAGMNQFKDVFLGASKRDYVRAVSSQKCIRVGGKHNDLDNVGHTRRHMTFFEMLGNFSFGDYFKKDAIRFAFEVTRDVFGLDLNRVWATVFEEDDEAEALWREFLPKERIVRMGAKDNFWAMGDTGPCGPCSELLFDRGESYGSARSPVEDATGERYLEFWNLVFMQYNRDSSGHLHPLPKQSVDTGAGLERVAMLKNNVDTVFATDILRRIIREVEKLSGREYVPQDESSAAFHVIADHLRSLSFAIADGAQPSNLDRGYVLRKLVRRAVRYSRSLGLVEPFLAKLVPVLCDEMGGAYPELIRAKARIEEVLTLEEEGFLRTLKRGGNLLQEVIEEARSSTKKEISGEKAFVLKDTYGMPLEEILLLAKDTGLSVNLEAYGLLEEEARLRSKKAHISHAQEAKESLLAEFASKHGAVKFVGYEKTEAKSAILGIFLGGAPAEKIEEGDEGEIVLKETPFYAEKGGQMGDRGVLMHHKGALFEVKDTQEPYPGVIVHRGRMGKGTLLPGEPVEAKVDLVRRSGIANHHTATHLLHWALQEVLGLHIRQAGSLVETDHLRFDFSHHKQVTKSEIREIERLVNSKIRENKEVHTAVLSFEEVQKRGEVKQLFGEKYGEWVRLVDIDESKELCGGTHTDRVGTIGLFKIAKEMSVAAGVRRIEAVTGLAAEALVEEEEDLLEELAGSLKTGTGQLKETLSHLLEEKKELTREVRELRKETLRVVAEKAFAGKEMVGTTSFVTATIDTEDGELLNLLGDLLFAKLSSGVLLACLKGGEKCELLARVTGDLLQKGIKAGDLIKEIAPVVGGGGGGRPEMARAGGKQPSSLPEAIAKARQWLLSRS